MSMEVISPPTRGLRTLLAICGRCLEWADPPLGSYRGKLGICSGTPAEIQGIFPFVCHASVEYANLHPIFTTSVEYETYGIENMQMQADTRDARKP